MRNAARRTVGVPDLDSEEFAARERACANLGRLGEAELALREALTGEVSAEVRRRVGEVLSIAATTDTADTVGSIDPSQPGMLTAVQAGGTANPGNVFRYQGATTRSTYTACRFPPG